MGTHYKSNHIADTDYAPTHSYVDRIAKENQAKVNSEDRHFALNTSTAIGYIHGRVPFHDKDGVTGLWLKYKGSDIYCVYQESPERMFFAYDKDANIWFECNHWESSSGVPLSALYRPAVMGKIIKFDAVRNMLKTVLDGGYKGYVANRILTDTNPHYMFTEPA